MKKYFDTISNKEIKLGEYVTRKSEEKFSFGTFYTKTSTLVTEETIPVLVKAGILREEEVKEADIPLNIDYYIQKIADKSGLDLKNTCQMLESLNKAYPAAVLQILLKEVASVLNHKKGGYKVPDTKYIINLATGSIMPVTVPKSKYVTTFYELEDAKLAKEKILKAQFDYMYGNNNY